VRYWDASALVPLLVDEPGTVHARRWLTEDPRIVTWSLTLVEVTGAIERRARTGVIPAEARRVLLRNLRALGEAWDEVVDLLPVRTLAQSLLARHPLRSADALQLAAAAVIAQGRPSSVTFICLDRALAGIAEREGFEVLSWPEG
jgi:hypothetical protein